MKQNPDRIFRIANSLGWKIRFGDWDAPDGISYHKGVITLYTRPKDVALRPGYASVDVVQNVAHEIGHYLVAPTSRRHRKNYGINRNFGHRDSDYWDLDDMKARFVERELMRACGMKHHLTYLMVGQHRKPAALWWEQEGKHLVAGLLMIK
jgi:hypothetical protein